METSAAAQETPATPAVQKFGIESLKKVIDLAIETETLAVHLVKNGKNWPADMKDLFDHVPTLVLEIQAVAASGAQIPLEIKDLDAEEAVQLVAYVSVKLTVDSEKAQRIIAASLQTISHLITDGVALSAAIRS